LGRQVKHDTSPALWTGELESSGISCSRTVKQEEEGGGRQCHAIRLCHASREERRGRKAAGREKQTGFWRKSKNLGKDVEENQHAEAFCIPKKERKKKGIS